MLPGAWSCLSVAPATGSEVLSFSLVANPGKKTQPAKDEVSGIHGGPSVVTNISEDLKMNVANSS
jgi:hypothetical protein